MGTGQGAGASEHGVQVDPGVDPGQNAQLANAPEAGGFLPGGGRGGGPSGAQMDALQGGRSGAGTGELGGEGDDAPHIAGQSSVPASLRAYVRRYLEAVRARGR
ncbi:MAG: hypothetical protein IT378_04850 [Sandaracinaceae bacterium]|nr:hypothetical protein [Sandaracinaceae bacterium]